MPVRKLSQQVLSVILCPRAFKNFTTLITIIIVLHGIHIIS